MVESSSHCPIFLDASSGSMGLRLVFVVIVLLSMISLLSVIITIFQNKHLRQHPSTLIAAICTVEAVVAWQSFIETPQVSGAYFVCYFGLDELLSSSMPFIELDNNTALRILTWSQEILFQYWQLESLLINLTFCQDLIQTLRNPFETTRARFYKYMLFSNIAPLVMTAGMWSSSDQRLPTEYLTPGIYE